MLSIIGTLILLPQTKTSSCMYTWNPKLWFIIGNCVKLAPCYYGPSTVLNHISSSAYHLDFLNGVDVHIVFHVSCLKEPLGFDNTITIKRSGNSQEFIFYASVSGKTFLWLNNWDQNKFENLKFNGWIELYMMTLGRITFLNLIPLILIVHCKVQWFWK